MNETEKRFMMFKFFLSMDGIFLKEDLSNIIERAYKNSLSNTINYNNDDAYYLEVINNAISNAQKLKSSK